MGRILSVWVASLSNISFVPGLQEHLSAVWQTVVSYEMMG
jgi:hypothetical protein